MSGPPIFEPPPEKSDEFRKRLKELGYLDNPLDKFFIGGAHGRTGVLAANLKIAVKVGILGGVFLGVVTALGLALLTPETYGALATAGKLAAYFSLIFTVLFAALEFVICLVVSILGRLFRRLFTRTQMIALYSGAFAGLVTVIYGTLWWWAGAAEGRIFSRESLAVLAVIFVLAAVAAVLTRLAVTALLALLGGADLSARGKGRATKLYFAVLISAVVVFVGYRVLTAPDVRAEPSPYQTVDTGISVTLIAVDGADEASFRTLTDRGECPNLSSLVKNGFYAGLLPSDLAVNAAVWTTVATGVTPRKHGVTSCSGQEIPGLSLYVRDRVGLGLYDALLSALPAVGLSRRTPLERRTLAYPAVWDIIAQKGDLSGVVNWWGTWPADDFHGFLVSDRMYPKLQVSRAVSGPAIFEREVYPRGLFDRLASYSVAAAGISDDPFRASFDIDRFAVSAAQAARGDYERLAFAAVYLPGLDIFENAVFPGRRPVLRTIGESDVLKATFRYWQSLDGLIGPLAELAGPSHVVIVVADPGMLNAGVRYFDSNAASGFVIIAGGPAMRLGSETPLGLVDVAPAVLYLLGYPVSEEMDGRVPLEAFKSDFVSSHPVTKVKTFGRLEVKSAGAYSIDSELVDRLRSLGYIQ